jgi:DNA-binding XRE family transcriptional regulator
MGRMKTLTPEARRAARVALYEDLEAGRLDIAATVRRMREITGMTQEAFGEKVAGVSRLTLAQIERGEGNPTLETLEKVGHAFGLTVRFVRRGDE